MKKILVVDDDIVMLRLFQLQVKRSNCEGFFFSDANLALEQLPKIAPDMAVLDYNLPKINGGELYRAIQSNPSSQGIPVIFVTGSADTATLREIQSLGPVEILSKPFSPRRLQTLIEELLMK